MLMTALALQGVAQIATGRIAGTVTDSSGAVIAGANVTLTNEATGVAQTVRSTSTGLYVFTAVNPGNYTMKVVRTGFSDFVVNGIAVHVQETATIPVKLNVGSIAQNVIVTAAAPLLQTQSAEVGQTVNEQSVNNLPLETRNWTSLGQLAPGVTTTGGGTTTSSFFVSNGVNYWENDIRLDGIDNNEEVYGGSQFSSNAAIIPPPDAIQEFKLQTGDFNAEFGHSTGSVMNAVLKSGTNQLHGDVWEYIRNTVFNANDYFANLSKTSRPPYHQNQFGGTIGGPVYIPRIYSGKNKTFWFFDYQGSRISSPASSSSNVPTVAMRDSNFTNFQDLFTLVNGTKTDALGRKFPMATMLDPATTRPVQPNSTDPVSGLTNPSSSVIYVRDPFYTNGSIAGITDFTGDTSYLNQLPLSRVDTDAQKLLALYPNPTPGVTGFPNYYQFPSQIQNVNQYDIRIDQNFSEKNLLFGAFDWSNTLYQKPSRLPGLAEGQNYGAGHVQGPRYAIALGYTHVFAPTLTNEVHLGWNQSIERIVTAESTVAGIPEQYGIQGVPSAPGNGGLPVINIGGLTGLGIAGYSPTLQSLRTLEIMDNVTKIHGSHVFKTGFQVDDIRGYIIQPPYGRGNFTYNGQYSDVPNQSHGYEGLADLLLVPSAATVPGGISDLGGLSQYQVSNYEETRDLRYYTGAYFQDDWNITRNLTLNLGLRWDHFTPYTNINGWQANMVADGGNGPTGTYYIPKEGGCSVPRSATFDALLVANNINLVCTSNKAVGSVQDANFAPRIGFSYRMNSRLVFRGGYGIAYGGMSSVGYGGTLGTNYPFLYQVTVPSINSQTPIALSSGVTATMENALTAEDYGNPANVNGLGVQLSGRQWNWQTPYTETLNFTIEDQFTAHDAIQAAWVGVLGRHNNVFGYSNAPSAIMPPGTDIYSTSVQGHVPFPSFSAKSAYQTSNGTSNYNSLQVVYQHQLNAGLSMVANYTFARCMTDEDTNNQGNPIRAEWLPGFGLKEEYGLCLTDATHVAHVSGTWSLPIGNGHELLGSANHVANALVGGWITNYIYTFQSGQPFNIPCPVSTTANFGCNADLVSGVSPYAGPHNQKQWLNPAAFANPPVATQIGQTDYSPLGGKPDPVRGPGFYNLDFSIFKQFSVIREKDKVEFRAEAFNLFNSHNFANPSSQLNFNSPKNFSAITKSRNGPRVLQLALKLYY